MPKIVIDVESYTPTGNGNFIVKFHQGTMATVGGDKIIAGDMFYGELKQPVYTPDLDCDD